MVKVRFSDQYTAGANGVTPSTNVFRGNGPNDPQTAAGGGSCSYWTAFSGLYDFQRTLGSKCKVTFQNGGANDVNIALLPYNAQNTLASITNIADAMELKRCRKGTLGNNNGGNNIKTLKAYASVAQILGVSKGVAAFDDNYKSAMNANPNREFYWGVMTQNVDQTNPTTVRFRIEITYYVRLYRSDFPSGGS